MNTKEYILYTAIILYVYNHAIFMCVCVCVCKISTVTTVYVVDKIMLQEN